MPTFSVRIFSGASVVPWTDPEDGGVPSRLNYDPLHPHRYLSVAPSTTVDVRATVAGVEAPLDAALGGLLFQWSWAEFSGNAPPAIVNPAGQSSKATFAVTTAHLGHHALLIWREAGGSI